MKLLEKVPNEYWFEKLEHDRNQFFSKTLSTLLYDRTSDFGYKCYDIESIHLQHLNYFGIVTVFTIKDVRKWLSFIYKKAKE